MWKSPSNTIIIPKEFTVGGIKYTVNMVENSEKNLDGALGVFTDILHSIQIAKTCRVGEEVINVPEEEIIKTYLHELGHCFGYYYNDDLSEEFANAFSHFIYEYLITKNDILYNCEK